MTAARANGDTPDAEAAPAPASANVATDTTANKCVFISKSLYFLDVGRQLLPWRLLPLNKGFNGK
jgi:hypothetical protein